MLHILKSSFGESLVADLAGGLSQPASLPKSIFGTPLSEASDSERASIFGSTSGSDLWSVVVSPREFGESDQDLARLIGRVSGDTL
jgi:hypothetical protein